MIDKFQDVRTGVSSKCDYKEVVDTTDAETIKTLTFNEKTQWVDATVAYDVMEYGKTPPLGIKGLHNQGYTGKGVTVAIIDQPLALDHPEYKGKIVEYKCFAPDDEDMSGSSMHGPAVASLLVGESLGVAPHAKLLYAAVPHWRGDAIYEVEALKWIIGENEKLPEDQKIKFVSVSAAPGDEYIRPKNSHLWIEALKEAEKAGVCVVDCTEGSRFVTMGYVDYQTRTFEYGFPNRKMRVPQVGEVHVPNSQRTVAESYDNKNFGYTYCGIGGLSWGIPYAVGVLCLGQQACGNMSAFELKRALIDTAAENNCIVNPERFIEKVEEQYRETESE